MISAICWVRKGASATQPKRYELNDEELQRIKRLAQNELDDAKLDLDAALKDEEEVIALQLEQTIADDDMEMDEDDDNEIDNEEMSEDDGNIKDDVSKEGHLDANGNIVASPPVNVNDLSEYNLDDYDNEPTFGIENATLFSNIKGLAYYSSNAEDPYITLKNGEEESDSEKEDLEILPTDNLLIAATTEDDISQLEIHIFEPSADNLYVHHDIMLPSFPLCLEWLDFKPGAMADDLNNSGSFIAVGTFHPNIEIWNLDTIDVLYPETILGGKLEVKTGGKKKRRKHKTVNDQYHVDAVMALSWNKQHRNFLASASADATVKIWDLCTSASLRSFNHHTDKVQSVHWNPHAPTVLLTGSYDRTVSIFDTRSPDTKISITLPSDVENAKWVEHNEMEGSLYVSTEDGCVRWYDLRNVTGGDQTPNAVFTLQAHDGPCSAADVNTHIPTMLVTGGADKKVKIWCIKNNKPTCVSTRELGIGKVFDLKFNPDECLTLGIAGSKGAVTIWDVGTLAGVRQAWSEEASKFVGPVGDRVVTIANDEEVSDEDDE